VAKLIRVLDDGRIPLDTNLVENAIRPFVVGRKNWLFADTMAGARASANLYGLIETAKANRIEPGRYLAHLFEVLPEVTLPKDIDALLPQNIDPRALSSR
jgi:transposase